MGKGTGQEKLILHSTRRGAHGAPAVVPAMALHVNPQQKTSRCAVKLLPKKQLTKNSGRWAAQSVKLQVHCPADRLHSFGGTHEPKATIHVISQFLWRYT